MKTAPGLTPAAIRALARQLALQLQALGDTRLCSQPGRIFCPKTVHGLSPFEDDAPDGLACDYLALAAELNGKLRAPAQDGDLLDLLRRTVETEIARARLLERELQSMLEGTA